ncbi:universal stress protein [Spongiivirga citrea]|uniref:Universal stress protein n=1 Tax=Spongiivirga citrea TaxID=1481457 RepID=A0A6M0CG37_9FLAO|nr:universal stress protein [Spongiivirga citrea]NER16828.1 universal stress protein [Spongiivirga citrea]
MKKKILLPTDFSKNSWNAIAYAIELYKNELVDFYLLNAFNASTYIQDILVVPDEGETLFERSKKKSQMGLKKILLQIKAHGENRDHNYFTASVFDSPLDAVKNCIEAKDIELVIVSNKGETNDLDTILGSNTIDMMEKVRNCPVLMIPADVTFKEPNEIVFPTSFKTHYKRRELTHLYEIAKITNAPIRVLHISKEDELSQDQIEKKALLEECLDGLEYSFHYLENTNVNNGLKLFVQSRESEMIVFINKKHAFFGSVLTKPMVKDLGYSSKVPVLALHDLRN